MTPELLKPAVLVTDDHAMNRAAFASILEKEYSVTLAASGRQALDLAASRDFAVILLDVRMPGMDGFETAENLRKRDRTRYTPIIFLSAYDQTVVQVKRGYVAGATDFLFSPVDEELLKFKVATYVSLHLRNEAMKMQVQQLNTLLQSLQAEINRRTPAEEILKDKIRELESVVDELERQVYTPTETS
jgi:CheY-like chemotaxis protein